MYLLLEVYEGSRKLDEEKLACYFCGIVLTLYCTDAEMKIIYSRVLGKIL